MKEYKIISVESRKGGVGKTTAALNIGYLLKERYHVLLLDIDITGTSIRAIQESRFWMNDARLLTEEEGKPLNLLQYFTNSYLKGEELFSFSSKQEAGKVCVYDDEINVIASELYGDDASLLYNPSLLLDNLHVYWLTKLITSICEGFANCFKDRKPSVIILDNSPGFVGIGKAVHDIMTDIGPERAKFITVSSLDIQDFESSLKSVCALHRQYTDKYYGARYPETQKGDEKFYAQVQLSGNSEYIYYRTQKRLSDLKSYQGLILNKVAKGIVEGRTRYDFKKGLTPTLEEIYEGLYEDRIKDYLVPFDNVLLTQFYGVFEEKQGAQNENLSTLKKRLATIEWQIKMLDELDAKVLPYDLLRRADGFDKTIDTLKGALIASGYDVIASKFNPDWSPVEPLRKMIAVLKDIGFTSESFELYVPRRNRMEREMGYFHGIASKAITFAEEQKQELVWLASAVASVACELSFCYSNKILWNNNRAWSNDETWCASKEKWANMVNDAMTDWMLGIAYGYSNFKSERPSLAAYVLSDDASFYDNYLRELFDRNEFLSTLKSFVSRLIDLGPDMQTLVNLIRAITVNNEESYSVDVDFVPFLNHKIIDKKYDYGLANDMMYSELRDSDYMAAFKEVLARVIHNWGL